MIPSGTELYIIVNIYHVSFTIFAISAANKEVSSKKFTFCYSLCTSDALKCCSFRQLARFWNRAHLPSKEISFSTEFCTMSRYPNRSGTAVSRSSHLPNSLPQGQPDPSQNSSAGFSPNTSPDLCVHGSWGGHQCWR